MTLELNAGQANAQLAQFGQNVEKAGNRAGQGFEKAGESGEKLLASTHRVAGQIKDVAASMLSGGSAAQTFSSLLDGLEHSLHLPLGALAGLGIGAVLIEQMAEAGRKADELRAHLRELTDDPANADFSSISELQSRLEDLKKTVDSAKGTMNAGIWDKFKLYGAKLGVAGVAEAGAGMFLGPDGVPLVERAAHKIEKEQGKEEKTKDTAESQVAKTVGEIAKEYNQEAVVLRIEANAGPFEAEKEKLTEEFKEQLGDVQKNLDPQTPKGLKA